MENFHDHGSKVRDGDQTAVSLWVNIDIGMMVADFGVIVANFRVMKLGLCMHKKIIPDFSITPSAFWLQLVCSPLTFVKMRKTNLPRINMIK